MWNGGPPCDAVVDCASLIDAQVLARHGHRLLRAAHAMADRRRRTLVVRHEHHHHHHFDKENVDPKATPADKAPKLPDRTVLKTTQLDGTPRTAFADLRAPRTLERTVVVNKHPVLPDETVVVDRAAAAVAGRESCASEWSLGRALSFGSGEPYSQLTDVDDAPATPRWSTHTGATDELDFRSVQSGATDELDYRPRSELVATPASSAKPVASPGSSTALEDGPAASPGAAASGDAFDLSRALRDRLKLDSPGSSTALEEGAAESPGSSTAPSGGGKRSPGSSTALSGGDKRSPGSSTALSGGDERSPGSSTAPSGGDERSPADDEHARDLSRALGERLRLDSDVDSPATTSGASITSPEAAAAPRPAPRRRARARAPPLDLARDGDDAASPRGERRSLRDALAALERSSGGGGAVSAAPWNREAVAAAVAELAADDGGDEEAAGTLVLAASAAQADEWDRALRDALGPGAVLRHGASAAALRRATPAHLGRARVVVATYAHAARADASFARAVGSWMSRSPAPEPASALHAVAWTRLVADDAHLLLSATTKRAACVARLRAAHTWAVLAPAKLGALPKKAAALRQLAALVGHPPGEGAATLLARRTVRLDDAFLNDSWFRY